MHKPVEFCWNEAVSLYEGGKSMAGIARQLGIGRTTLTTVFHEKLTGDLAARFRKAKSLGKLRGKDWMPVAVEQFRAGKPVERIAESYGITGCALARCFQTFMGDDEYTAVQQKYRKARLRSALTGRSIEAQLGRYPVTVYSTDVKNAAEFLRVFQEKLMAQFAALASENIGDKVPAPMSRRPHRVDAMRQGCGGPDNFLPVTRSETDRRSLGRADSAPTTLLHAGGVP